MSLQPITQIFRNELCLCMYLCQVKVRFFAQPCTIVKQSCGPKDDLLFTQLFSLSKNCMHYEVQGCAEILPLQILYLMTHSYMSTSNWPSPNVLPHCNSFKHKWNFELEKAEFYGIFFNPISAETNSSRHCWWDYPGVHDKVYIYKWIGMESSKTSNYAKNLGLNCETISGDVHTTSH